MAATKARAVETRVIEIERRDERLRVTIPASAKITYGKVNPGEKYGDGLCALRIYEGSANNQRAIFLGVTSFRDTSYTLQRLAVAEEGSREWEKDDGGTSLSERLTRRAEWEDVA